MAIDTSLLDKAIIFATKAHQGQERRGTGMPYIVHPMEVVSIIGTITSDQELLAAGALHDTIEDCGVTYEEIKKEFGQRVADLVQCESDEIDRTKPEEETWHERKQKAIDRLASASYDAKVVALGDKLSNIRAIRKDFKAQGDKVWDKFHIKDPREHEWHYRGLATSLQELANTKAYKEFIDQIDKVFSRAGYLKYDLTFDGKKWLVRGELNRENSLKLEASLKPGEHYNLDFSCVPDINFAGIRTLLRMNSNNINMTIVNTTKRVFHKLNVCGANDILAATLKPYEYDMSQLERSGDGFTALSYFNKDNDSMAKIYNDFVSPGNVIREKIIAQATLKLGVNTPLSGDLIKVGKKTGITFERIMNKKSIARALADNPERNDELAKLFATEAKKLHATKTNKKVFKDIVDIYINAVNSCDGLSDDERKLIIKWLEEHRGGDTCIHGDFHVGNVITTDCGETLFIDMADFAYGYPEFDIGNFCYIANGLPEHMIEEMYHVSKEALVKFYDKFIEYYYDIHTKEEREKIDEIIAPYAGAKVIFFACHLTGLKPDMREFVEKNLLNKINENK